MDQTPGFLASRCDARPVGMTVLPNRLDARRHGWVSAGAGPTRSCFSHLLTITAATELPTTLVALRPMSSRWSTPRISSNPASGMLKHRQGGGDHHQRSARHAGDALGGDHQGRQHRDLLAQAEMDAVGLGDEQAGEGAIHHRAVQVERVAQRQHEADDLARHAEPLQARQQIGIGGLGGGGGEGQQPGLADVAQQGADPAPHRQAETRSGWPTGSPATDRSRP